MNYNKQRGEGQLCKLLAPSVVAHPQAIPWALVAGGLMSPIQSLFWKAHPKKENPRQRIRAQGMKKQPPKTMKTGGPVQPLS